MSEMEPEREYIGPKELARGMRSMPTPAEEALWQELKESKTGYKFCRQIKVCSYYADFCSRQYRLVVEVDGGAHDRRPEHDEARDRAMRERGFEVLRFRNEQVLEHPDRVVAAIVEAIERRPRRRY